MGTSNSRTVRNPNRRAANDKDDPQSRCLPRGAIRLYTDGMFKKIVQVPGMIAILSERNASYRQIFTDGRPLPVDPQSMGVLHDEPQTGLAVVQRRGVGRFGCQPVFDADADTAQ